MMVKRWIRQLFCKHDFRTHFITLPVSNEIMIIAICNTCGKLVNVDSLKNCAYKKGD